MERGEELGGVGITVNANWPRGSSEVNQENSRALDDALVQLDNTAKCPDACTSICAKATDAADDVIIVESCSDPVQVGQKAG